MSPNQQIKTSICGFCPNRCRVQVRIEDGRLLGMEEDREHPAAKLFAPVVRACPRARAAAEWFYHPERLRYPLKRAGERGENRWEPISWDQALNEIAEGLDNIRRKHGAEAVACSDGETTGQAEYRARFLHLLGAPNYMGSGSVCWCASNALSSALLGFPSNMTAVRAGATQCILLMGTNPATSARRMWYSILEAQKSGARLLVVDPRRSEAAARADVWLQPRPGTDPALLLGMLHVILQENLYDREFVEKWCYGFEKLKERVRQYPLEKVAEITLVPAEKIQEAARIYTTCKPGAIHHGMGLEQIPQAVQSLLCRFILPAITGNLDVRGGEALRGLHPQLISQNEVELDEALSPGQRNKMIGAERFRLLSWEGDELIQSSLKKAWGRRLNSCFGVLAHAPLVLRAMLTSQPYPVRSFLCVGTNVLTTLPNTRLVHKALKSLDLLVVQDFFMIPTALLADYVLPAASWLERPMLWTYDDTLPNIDAGEAVFPPFKEGEYDRRTDYDLYRGLGVRLGQQEHWPWKNLEEAYDYRLSPAGHTFKGFVREKKGFDYLRPEYKKYETHGFGTPTGKVELYSTVLEKLGYDPLPSYSEPPRTPYSDPEMAKEYPLILISGAKNIGFYHSQQRQINGVRCNRPDPILEIHPETAKELGIADGDWVWIETPTGKAKQRCQYFAGIQPNVVNADHGWWYPEEPGEEPWLHGAWEPNINMVMDDNPQLCDESGGGWVLRGVLCRVRQATRYGEKK